MKEAPVSVCHVAVQVEADDVRAKQQANILRYHNLLRDRGDQQGSFQRGNRRRWRLMFLPLRYQRNSE
jgi:hypothetical protein